MATEDIEYLYSLGKFGIKLGLDNTKKLMDIAGNPHEGMKGVHIAGTNGKGSVAAMLTSIMEKAGYRPATYTSPHLVNFEERMMISGKPIEREELVALIERYRKAVDELNRAGVYPTFFEVTTSIAFDYFRRRDAFPWIIEVGMGGRLDSTNIVGFGTGVITSIGMDHMKYLGNTAEKIAEEKAGIIKPGMNIVTAASGAVLNVIEKRAEKEGADVFALSRDFDAETISVSLEGTETLIHGIYGDYRLRIPLIGRHQSVNAALAVVSAELMRNDGIYADRNAIISGISTAVWKGRFDVVSRDPLVIMDAAHNPHGALALSRTIKDVGLEGKYTLVLGMLKDKDIRSTSEILMRGAKRTIITQPEYTERAMDSGEFLKITESGGLKAEAEPSPRKAVRKAVEYGDPVLITGSIYLLGDILSSVNFNELK